MAPVANKLAVFAVKRVLRKFGGARQVRAVGKKRKRAKHSIARTGRLLLAVFPLIGEHPLIRVRKPFRGSMLGIYLWYRILQNRKIGRKA